jgi:hypothetical protein
VRRLALRGRVEGTQGRGRRHAPGVSRVGAMHALARHGRVLGATGRANARVCTRGLGQGGARACSGR